MSELVSKTLELLAESKGAFASAVKNIFDTKTMATLKINDLSVGDWVMVEWPDGERWRGRLTRLSVTGGVEVCCANGKHVRCSTDFISSIPITAEILEKNGWSNDGMYAILRIDEHLHLEYYYHEHRLRKYYCGVDEWQNHEKVTDITFAVHCYSVHQLQHALRLAGVDKEINL